MESESCTHLEVPSGTAGKHETWDFTHSCAHYVWYSCTCLLHTGIFDLSEFLIPIKNEYIVIIAYAALLNIYLWESPTHLYMSEEWKNFPQISFLFPTFQTSFLFHLWHWVWYGSLVLHARRSGTGVKLFLVGGRRIWRKKKKEDCRGVYREG